MKIREWGLAIALVLLPSAAVAAAQQPAQTPQDQKPVDALAAAARKAREQKKDQPKPAKVWDNDSLPKQGELNVVGDTGSNDRNAEAGEASDSQPAPAEAGAQAAPSSEDAAAEAKRKAEISSEIAQTKDQLQSLNTDLDILARKYALDQQSYYGETGYASDKAGAAKLKDEENQIADKKQAIADAQKKIDDLTRQLNESKAPANPQ